MPRQSKGLRDLGEKFTSEDRTVHTTDGKAYPVRFNLETGRFSQRAGPKIPDTQTSHTGFADFFLFWSYNIIFIIILHEKTFQKMYGLLVT